MPVLPGLHQRVASASQDTRIPDSRQLRAVAQQAAQAISSTAERLLRSTTSQLQTRQNGGNIVAIPTVYQGLNAGPAPGTVVGIVLGSVCAFLLLLYLLYAVSNNSGGLLRTSQDQEEEVVVRRDRSRRSSRRTEMTERSPRRERERERIIRQERIVRDVNPPRAPSHIRETVIVDDMMPERRVANDDIVEVIEEHSSLGGAPPPRRPGRRGSGYRRGIPGDYSDI